MHGKKITSAFSAATNLRLAHYEGHACHTVDVRDPRSVALLTTAYETIYKPAFPNPADRESALTTATRAAADAQSRAARIEAACL